MDQVQVRGWSATRKLFVGRPVGGPNAANWNPGPGHLTDCSVIASKPDYPDGLRRKNGLNLGDSLLYCAISQSKDREGGRKRRDSLTSREKAGSLQTVWRRGGDSNYRAVLKTWKLLKIQNP